MDEFDIYIAGFEEQAGDAPEEQLARVFGLGMVEALEFVESLPRVVKRRVPGAYVERYRRALEEVHARYELRRSPIRPTPIIAVAGRRGAEAEAPPGGRSGRTLTLPPPRIGEPPQGAAVPDHETTPASQLAPSPPASSPRAPSPYAPSTEAFAPTERPPARPSFGTQLEAEPIRAAADPAKTLVDSRPPMMIDTMDGWQDVVADPVPRPNAPAAGKAGAATIGDGSIDEPRGGAPAYAMAPPIPPASDLGAPPAYRPPARPTPPAWVAIEPTGVSPVDEGNGGISVPPPNAGFDGDFPAPSEVPGLKLQSPEWLVRGAAFEPDSLGAGSARPAPGVQPARERLAPEVAGNARGPAGPSPGGRPARERLAPQVAGNARHAASAPPATSRPSAQLQAAEPPLGMRIVLRIGVGLALFLLVVSIRQSGIFGDAISDRLQQWGGGFAERLEREDAVRTSRREPVALDWMESDTHQFGNPDKDSVRALVRRYLDAGAVQVYVGEIRRELMMARAGVLIVELPLDDERRAEVFEMQTSYFAPGVMRPGIPDRLEDVGQDIITVRF